MIKVRMITTTLQYLEPTNCSRTILDSAKQIK